MPKQLAHIMCDVLIEHLEEIGFLWTRRHLMIRSASHDVADLGELDQRMTAHLDGLEVGGIHCIELVRPMLCEEDPEVVFAAAACLIRIGHEDELILSLNEIPLSALDGLSDAMCFFRVDSLIPDLQLAFETASEANASMLGIVLMSHDSGEKVGTRLDEFHQSEDPMVRRRAMQILGLTHN